MDSTDIFIFGDQTTRVEGNLRDLILIRNDALLASFLDESFLVLQREISTLPVSERGSLTKFRTLGLLVEVIQNGRRHAALESACLCIYEIGYYIRCSHNIYHVSRLGLQAVAVAFRMGMRVHRKAETLGSSNGGQWSIILSGMQEENVAASLAEYSAEKDLPKLSMPYISAVGPNNVTLSGPPSVLDTLVESTFSDKKVYHMPIYGPYHSPSVYHTSEVSQILEASLLGIQFLESQALGRHIFCASGAVIEATTFGALLKSLIRDALVEQIRLDRVTEAICALPATVLIPINTQTATGISNYVTRKSGNTRVEDLVAPLTSQSPPTLHEDASKIAIIGFSGRFPEADDLGEFWDLLRQGLDVHKVVPPDRFDGQAHYDPTGQRKNTSKVQYGCWIRQPGLFDSRFFHLSPREACQSDPSQRLTLLTAYEALEMAGFVADRTASSARDRVGVFYGITSDDWREVNSGQNVDTYFIPGGNRAFVPGRINYHFKFSGPSISVDTACSSSMAAINIAITSLLNRDCDTAIAGGTNVMTNPDNFAGLDRGHFLSTTGNCKTFDDSADGYCRADGVGTLILKRLSDAIADEDPIFGVVLGAQTNHSSEAVSITRPLADAQERLFRNLLNLSGISPYDISYIEMHGTGTQAGDAVEMQSVLNTFAWDHARPKDKSLYIGSVKSNVGHSESASGVTAIIKVLMMMQQSKIPPHCGIKSKINHGFPTDLAQRGVHIALDGEADWTRPNEGVRRAFINNFSAAGGNTALLMEDGPAASEVSDFDTRANHVVTLSARSSKSLKENLEALARFIEISEKTPHSLGQLSYTTTARRIHHNRRATFVANDFPKLISVLRKAANDEDSLKPIPAKAPKIGFLFTGQGAQQSAMGSGLYRAFSTFRSDIHEFDGVAQTQGLPSILPLVDGSVPIEELSPTAIQLGTCVIQIAMARLWINFGLQPAYVIGHSLGEYAALHVAGVLSIGDTIWLCGQRALQLESSCTPETHGMVAVMASQHQLKQVIDQLDVEVACINGPEDTVLSGPNAAINEACKKLEGLKYKFTKLALPFAFHSSQVDPLLPKLEEMSRHVTFQSPQIPVASTVLGKVVATGGVFGPQYLVRHCRETVDFLGAVQSAKETGVLQASDVCIEIGTHPLLSRMMKSILGTESKCYPSLRRGEDTFKTLPETLAALHSAGVAVNWDEYHRDFPSSHKVLRLPSYSWDYGNYWIQYQPNWCLTKGDPIPEVLPAAPVAAPRAKPIRLSTSVQEIVELTCTHDHASVVAESDLHDPDLLKVAEGHRVNGLTLCPSSLYADVAMTLAKHLIGLRYPNEVLIPDVCNVVVVKALIVNQTGPQSFAAALNIDWKSKDGNMEIYSVDASGKQTTTHVTMQIEIRNPQGWMNQWQRQQYLIQRSIQQLQAGNSTGPVHKLGRGMAYKMFSAEVQYGSPYQGMEEVAVDSTALEATARVRLQPVSGKYLLNPFWIDSFGHLSGFTLNTSDSLDLSDHVYINQGWTYMRCSETFASDAKYQTYVKMQPLKEDDSSYSGDVFILRDNKIVAVYGSVTFNKVSRRVLQMLLPAPGSSKRSVPTPAVKQVVPKPSTHFETNPMQIARPSAHLAAVETRAPSRPSVFSQVLKVVAEEIGIDQAQLTDDANFADFGVDSLMSLTILGFIRDDLGIDVPGSLFDDYPSVKELRVYLATLTIDDSSGNTSETSGSEVPTGTTTPLTVIDDVDDSKPADFLPPATSIVLQGSKNSAKCIFLFPDGSGSASSYSGLPKVPGDVCLVGMNCPYIKNPQELKCSLQDLTTPYLAEIRRRQPRGPYNLAGWSAGGIAAYDAAQRLVDEGETVERLVLLDSPNPIGLEKLPPRFYKFLESAGVFGAAGGKKAPEWLIQHFLAFIDALDKYKPVRFRATRVPKTTLIWALDGVCKDPTDPRPVPQPDDPKEMRWLLENRPADPGFNGWDTLLGPENIEVKPIKGVNHFTMVREPGAAALVQIIGDALAN
ncbi:polyketide synthase [Lophiostoma macrostomum CBS 122681]|uniref:Polyketide synthase n=1 Tax=Lophiostoma macrostomum CBS 122681 TaxID=1314788 RepID=A0A6A6SS51_9PLEO|nr:polyketide synthase [Lophiostoma macrostomum CBS 122681]